MNLGVHGKALAVIVASALVLAGATPANAEELPPALEIAEAVDTSALVLDSASLSAAASSTLERLVPDSSEAVDGVVATDTAVATLPDETDPTLTTMNLESGDAIGIAVGDEQPTATEGAAVTYEDEESGVFVVQVTPEGAVQVINVQDDPVASHSFDVNTSVPAGSSWVTAAGGSLNLQDAGGQVIAVADVPWSIDANGTYLPTEFVVEGSTITQVVDTSAAVFPVVSDPSIWWVIATVAACAVEIAALAFASVKVIQAFAKANGIIKSMKKVAALYDREPREPLVGTPTGTSGSPC